MVHKSVQRLMSQCWKGFAIGELRNSPPPPPPPPPTPPMQRPGQSKQLLYDLTLSYNSTCMFVQVGKYILRYSKMRCPCNFLISFSSYAPGKHNYYAQLVINHTSLC